MEINKKISGVSLIEVMISMVLIALLLIAVASVFPRMSSHRKGIQESDIAKTLATETLEYLQWLTANESNTIECSTLPPPSNSEYIEPQYERRVIVPVTYYIDWGTDCGGSINTVEIIVTWTKQGKPHNVKVTGAIK